MAKRFYDCLRLLQENHRQKEGWLNIETLSQLKTVVGGRLSTVKQKWTTANLPLRRHKGDREEPWEIAEDGWQALVLWLQQQGFEVHPNSSKECAENRCFLIRKSDNSSSSSPQSKGP